MIVQYACLGGIENNLTSRVPTVPRCRRCRARCGYSLAVGIEVVVAPIAELRKRMTTRFEEIVGKALAAGDGATAEPYRFSCGITGGSAALIFLGALRDADVPWRRITLYW